MNKAVENPYIGPRTFQEDERNRFFGREREARELLGLMVSEPLVLFYAQSGAGKSSLVNTCLIPDLKRRGYNVFPTGRLSGSPPSTHEANNIYVYKLIRSLDSREADPDTLVNVSLTEFLAGSDKDENDERMLLRKVIIIDQFEELFSLHLEAWKKREDFFSQLSQAMDDHPNISVLMVMREDYIAQLDPYSHLVPGKLRVRYYMQRLDHRGALMAARGPVAHVRPFAPGVAEKLINDLSSIRVNNSDGTLASIAGQFIEPVQLQVLCFELWRKLPPEGTQITDEHLDYIGDVNASLGNYYAERVREVAEQKHVSERKIRSWFENRLISPGGVRNLVLREEGNRKGELDDEVIRVLLGDLVRAETRGGATFYELTHDRLVEPILDNNQRWFEEHQSPLQRQAGLWLNQNQNESWLLSDQALVEVQEWAKTHPDELTDIEKEFLEASQKLQARIEEKRNLERQRLESSATRIVQRAGRYSIFLLILFLLTITLLFILVGRNVQDTIFSVILAAISLILGYVAGRARQ